MPIEYNELETKRFGIRCARITNIDAPLETVNAAAKTENIAFLSIRVPTDNVVQVQALEKDGYRLMDTLVYYHKPLTNDHPETHLLDGLEIDAANQASANHVAKVAEKAFSDFFGHFHADIRLPQATCDAVYVDWARHCVALQTEQLPVLIARYQGSIVGFLSAQPESANCADIVLNAVVPQMQKRGIYGALLDRALQQMRAAGYKEAISSTQINNISVQRAWGKRGFRIQRSFYTLHKWMDANGP